MKLAKAKFRYEPALDLTKENNTKRLVSRAQTRAGKLLASTFKYENVNQLGNFGSALKRSLERSNADLFITHSAVSMWAVTRARKPLSKIAVDMEDWFSEEFPANGGGGHPIRLIRSLENALLPKAAYCSCTSTAISEELAKTFQTKTGGYLLMRFVERCNNGCSFRSRIRVPIHWSQTLALVEAEDLWLLSF